MEPIYYGKQLIDQSDIDAVVKVLQSDFLTQGPAIEKFEKEFAAYVGSKYAIAVSNGTAALHLSMMSMEITENDYVIVPSLTFVATPNSVRYCGAHVFFVDVNPETYLIDIDLVKLILEQNTSLNFKGIVPVNFAGKIVNLEELHAITTTYKLWIIEDACHSPGGYFRDSLNNIQKCGNAKYSDLVIFSFHPVKHIACGEGGMITTNNQELYHKILKLRTHGITKNNAEFLNPISLSGGDKEYPTWYMEMQNLGYNYRLTDIQAALGSSQLLKADLGIQKRREIASYYTNKLSVIEGVMNIPKNDEGHAYHLFVIEVEKRLELYEYLKAKNIFCQIHYFPCHLMPYYKNIQPNVLNNVESYYERCISLPMFPALTITQLEYIVKCISDFYEF